VHKISCREGSRSDNQRNTQSGTLLDLTFQPRSGIGVLGCTAGVSSELFTTRIVSDHAIQDTVENRGENWLNVGRYLNLLRK
jgi:hypothetical protein